MPSVELWMGAVKKISSLSTISVCLCSLSLYSCLSSVVSSSHIFSPELSSFFPFFLPLHQLLLSFCLIPCIPPSPPQGQLCCLWMLLIWMPRGSSARPRSSTPWRAPLSSVSTRAQVCVCVCVCVCVFWKGNWDMILWDLIPCFLTKFAFL